MTQTRLFPLYIDEVIPANLGTADLKHIGIGEDGLEYAIKTTADGPMIPAAEWICSSLAQLSGLAVPIFHIAELPNGAKVFASRWEGDIINQADMMKHLAGMVPGTALGDALTAIFALDVLISNPDRHVKNYMLRKPSITNGAPVLMAFDFSRAFASNQWPLPQLPLDKGCNTCKTWPVLVRKHPITNKRAKSVLNRLQSLSTADFNSIVDQMPKAWASSELKEEFRVWWEFCKYSRIEHVNQALRNGSYL